MRINKIKINDFGKLHDFEMNLLPGFNLIKRENEFGKTTIMSFVYMVFYNPVGDRKRNATDNLRMRYQPVYGDKMGGQIEFTWKDEEYVISRTFGKSVQTDVITLAETRTGQVKKLSPETEPGKTFFGMDSDTFLKIVYAGEKSDYENKNNEIAMKMSNAVENGDEDICAEDILKTIKSQKLETEKKIKSLSAEIVLWEEKKEKNLREYEEYEHAEEKVKSGFNKLNETKEAIKQAEDGINTIMELERLKNAHEEISQAAANDTMLTVANYNEIYDLVRLEEELKSKKNAFSAVLRDDVMMIEEDEYQEYMENLKLISDYEDDFNEIKYSSRYKIFYLVALLLLASGIILLFRFLWPGILLMVLSLAMIIIGGDLHIDEKEKKYLKQTLKKDEKQLKEQNEKILVATNTTEDTFCDSYNASARNLEIISKVRDCSSKLKENESRLESVLSCYEGAAQAKNIYAFAKRILNENVRMDLETKRKYSILSVLGMSEEELDKRMSMLSDKALEHKEWKKGVAFLTEKKNALLKELPQLEKEFEDSLKSLVVPKENNSYYRKTLKDLNISLESQKEKKKVLEVADEQLKKAVSEAKGNFGGDLSHMAEKIFCHITNGNYVKFYVDENFDINVSRKDGTMVSWRYLSTGTVKQAYFSIRMAMAEMFSNSSEKVPLFLDDIFLAYDESRRKKAMEYIENYAKKHQVVFFTAQ